MLCHQIMKRCVICYQEITSVLMGANLHQVLNNYNRLKKKYSFEYAGFFPIIQYAVNDAILTYSAIRFTFLDVF